MRAQSGGGGMEDVSLNDVNNLVVSLRPKVAQAKVHLVRHLVRQAAKLDKRKSGGDREKCARKAQRMRAEVAFINKMERDEVAKFAIGSAVTLEVGLSMPQPTAQLPIQSDTTIAQ